MNLGFVGTGHIAASIIEGLCTASKPPERILVSPRNAEKAASLAARFDCVTVAADNQAVVDGSECVILGVLPPVAPEIIRALRFRPDHLVISVIATRTLDEIRALVEPARYVALSVPLPPVACHLGPVAYYPDEPRVGALWSKVGTAVPAKDEDELNVLWSLTALPAPFFSLLEDLCQWCQGAGVDASTAGRYAASMLHALASQAMDVADGRFARLAEMAATPGGLNEQAVNQVRATGGYANLLRALDGVLARMRHCSSGPPQC